MAFRIMSDSFSEGQPIPAKFTCQGEDISPALRWLDSPKGVKSMALIMDDPDAPGSTWVHWIIFNLSPEKGGLPEAVTTSPEGSYQGLNSWKKIGYGGPCPPSGTHRYFFKLYALDSVLQLEEGVNSAHLMKAMKGHILGEAVLMGTYRKS